MSATGAFATIVIERLLDMITVLVLLASYVFVFGRELDAAQPGRVRGGEVGRRAAPAAVALAALVVLFFLAGNPARLAATLPRLEQVLPSALAGLLGRIAEKFATGLGAIRRPGRLLAALAAVAPAVAVDRARHLGGGACLPPRRAVHRLVPASSRCWSIGVAVPTPGAVGGFHEVFRLGATAFFGAPNDGGGRRRHRAARDVDRPVAACSGCLLRRAGRAEPRRHAAPRRSGRTRPDRVTPR